MIGLTDNSLSSIWMFLIEIRHERLHKVRTEFISIHVLFFENCFQFRLEQSENRMFEAMRIQFHPFFHLTNRESIEISHNLVGSKGIHHCRSHTVEQFIQLVWNSIFACLQRQSIYFLLDFLAAGIVGSSGKFIVLHNNAVEVNLFGLVIDCSNLVSSLEHHVFKIMRSTCMVGWIVFSTSLNSDSAKNNRCIWVFVEIYAQAIRKFIIYNF